jgi:uncharacterized membrane protein YedE/YeeE
MRLISAFLIGGLFGAGLLVSGMTDTRKVQGWLDFFGAWDPTLAFVLGGAILPMLLAWRLTRTRAPVFGGTFPKPSTEGIDGRLVTGSVLFGMGWGLSGLCPGPAIASLSFGGAPGAVFMGAMVLGMLAAPPIIRRVSAA